jgi:hypothetical protein
MGWSTGVVTRQGPSSWRRDSTNTPATEGALLVPYPATLDVSHELVEQVAWLLHEHQDPVSRVSRIKGQGPSTIGPLSCWWAVWIRSR